MGRGETVINPENLGKALRIIKDAEVRLVLLQNIVGAAQKGRPTFQVYDDETKKIAFWVISRFTQEKRIVEYMKQQIEEYDEMIREENERRAKWVEVDTFADMRRKPQN